MDITLGSSVQVTASTDIWLAEIRAGRAFVAGGSLAAGVGVFSELQVLNPVASGKTCIVRQVFLTASVAVNIQVRQHDVALAALVKNGSNLLRGAAAGAGQLRSAQPAALDGALVGEISVQAGTPVYLVPDWFYELGQQTGVLFATSVVNVGLSIMAMWREL